MDYRCLNAQTIKDAYPIPRIAEDLDALSGSSYFTSLRLNMAYYQIQIGGLYQYTVMPFGLRNAPATFQRAIEHTLRRLKWHVASYI